MPGAERRAPGALIHPARERRMSLRLCFVAHRAAPFPGGTEVFVQSMAEEAQSRGHAVTVLATQHRGDHRGVRITADMDILERETFDLVIVHGATEGAPRATLERAAFLRNPVLYQIVAHRSGHVRRRHLLGARLLGWSTPLDQAVIARHGLQARATQVRHGIRPDTALGLPGFRARHGIAPDRLMFVSCGGYMPHKRMRPLARLFARVKRDAILVTTGYGARVRAMPGRSERVLPLVIDDHAEVLSAIAEADCYLMHSREEGFGLVLLEAMLNRTPWIAHATGGATVLPHLGQTYRHDRELVALIEGFARNEERVRRAEAEVLAEHTIARCVDDIEAGAGRIARDGRTPPPVAQTLLQRVFDGFPWRG